MNVDFDEVFYKTPPFTPIELKIIITKLRQMRRAFGQQGTPAKKPAAKTPAAKTPALPGFEV